MNREEALEYVGNWQKWPEDGSIPAKGAPKEWSWWNSGVRVILVHSIHDPISYDDWRKARTITLTTPASFVETAPIMNRDEALEYTTNYVRWPKNGTSVSTLPNVPTGWRWMNHGDFQQLIHPTHDPITYSDWAKAVDLGLVSTPTPNKYQRTVPSTTIDVYDVLHAYSVTNPATQHAIKKLLQPGNRGYKDTLTDLREALASIQRAIQIEEQSTRG